MKKSFCKRANKISRSQENAEGKASDSSEYRRAYKCEFCGFWHITSRLKHENIVTPEPEELDID